MNLPLNQVIHGDCLEVMKTLPSESVDCVITSPPYWALRDYGVKGQLGLEPTFQEYITKLCDIFDEVKRVLRKDGTCWVNLGDTYAGTMPKTKEDYGKNSKTAKGYRMDWKGTKNVGVSDKCLIQIPSRFSVEMINRGWILRNEIIWHKPNCMPSSADDRFTVDFEKVFFFVKNKKYYFEQQFEPTIERYSEQRAVRPATSLVKADYIKGKAGNLTYNKLRPEGKNKRCVWSINTRSYNDAHFATFPETLVEPMIAAGCPEGGVVLDPFFGAGTTGLVAKKAMRNYIGIELNPEYIKIADNRLASLTKQMF